MKNFTVLDLIDLDLKEHDALNLSCIGGRSGLPNVIEVPNLNRPGLTLSGFFNDFGSKRIQIFGRGESAYLHKLEDEKKTDTIKNLFNYEIPCVIFTHNIEPTSDFFNIAVESNCPVLRTDLPTSEFSFRLIRALNNVFAPPRNDSRHPGGSIRHRHTHSR